MQSINFEVSEEIKQSGRLKVVRLNSRILEDFLKSNESFRIESNIPIDAILCRIWLNEERQDLHMVFYHESFESVKDSGIIPDLINATTFYRINP